MIFDIILFWEELFIIMLIFTFKFKFFKLKIFEKFLLFNYYKNIYYIYNFILLFDFYLNLFFIHYFLFFLFLFISIQYIFIIFIY